MRRPLFGGAIQANIPTSYRDVSDIRQVPDHQECWQDLTTNSLLVIEILDHQKNIEDSNAAQYFFNDLAESNGCSGDDCNFKAVQKFSNMTRTSNIGGSKLPPNAVVLFGIGYQKVGINTGGKQDEEQREIKVEMCVIRLPSVQTDLLITLSSPATSEEDKATTTSTSSDVFREILSTFEIADWSLFGSNS